MCETPSAQVAVEARILGASTFIIDDGKEAGVDAEMSSDSESVNNGAQLEQENQDCERADLESTSTVVSISSLVKGDSKESRISTLKAFAITRGPDNLTYCQAARKLLCARRSIERLSTLDNLGANGAKVLTAAQETVEDKELSCFVKKQKLAREKLRELGVHFDSEHLLQETFKRQRSDDTLQGESKDKRTKAAQKDTTPASKEKKTVKFSVEPEAGPSRLVNPGKKGPSEGDATIPKRRQSTSKAVAPTKGKNDTNKVAAPNRRQSTSKAATSKVNVADSTPSTTESSNSAVPATSNVDNSLKIVLVDDDKDRGRVDHETAKIVELAILERFASQGDDEEDECLPEASWEQGRRVYDCVNEKTLLFMTSCFKDLSFENKNLRLIPYDDRASAGHPRGWIWVRVPHVNPELLLSMLHKQNKSMNIRGNWSVLRVGKKKEFGQFFLLQIHRSSLPILAEKKYEVRIGFGTSLIKLEKNVKLNADEEPQHPIDIDVDESGAD